MIGSGASGPTCKRRKPDDQGIAGEVQPRDIGSARDSFRPDRDGRAKVRLLPLRTPQIFAHSIELPARVRRYEILTFFA
jgi:hypothetical protein